MFKFIKKRKNLFFFFLFTFKTWVLIQTVRTHKIRILFQTNNNIGKKNCNGSLVRRNRHQA